MADGQFPCKCHLTLWGIPFTNRMYLYFSGGFLDGHSPVSVDGQELGQIYRCIYTMTMLTPGFQTHHITCTARNQEQKWKYQFLSSPLPGLHLWTSFLKKYSKPGGDAMSTSSVSTRLWERQLQMSRTKLSYHLSGANNDCIKRGGISYIFLEVLQNLVNVFVK